MSLLDLWVLTFAIYAIKGEIIRKYEAKNNKDNPSSNPPEPRR